MAWPVDRVLPNVWPWVQCCVRRASLPHTAVQGFTASIFLFDDGNGRNEHSYNGFKVFSAVLYI